MIIPPTSHLFQNYSFSYNILVSFLFVRFISVISFFYYIGYRAHIFICNVYSLPFSILTNFNYSISYSASYIGCTASVSKCRLRYISSHKHFYFNSFCRNWMGKWQDHEIQMPLFNLWRHVTFRGRTFKCRWWCEPPAHKIAGDRALRRVAYVSGRDLPGIGRPLLNCSSHKNWRSFVSW